MWWSQLKSESVWFRFCISNPLLRWACVAGCLLNFLPPLDSDEIFLGSGFTLILLLLLLLHLHLFSGLFFRTTWVRWHQKGKPFLILLEQEMMGWHWHELDFMQIFAPHCRQITMPVPYYSIFTGRVPFLPPSQQNQSTEGFCIIRPHRSTTYVNAAYCYWPSSVVCRSVTLVTPAKTVALIKMPFGSGLGWA